MVDHKLYQPVSNPYQKPVSVVSPPLGGDTTYLLDPSPDGPDTRLWTILLNEAKILDPEDKQGAIGLVHGLRLMGARLVDKGDHYEFRNGAIEADEWYIIAGRWYEPRRALMTRILATKGRTDDEHTRAT